MLVYNDGQLFWVPPVTTHTTCNLDYRYWPWDIQVCNLIIGSWTKSGWEIDVVNMDKQNVCSTEWAEYPSFKIPSHFSPTEASSFWVFNVI